MDIIFIKGEGSETLNWLPKVTNLVNARIGTQSQAVCYAKKSMGNGKVQEVGELGVKDIHAFFGESVKLGLPLKWVI